MPITYLMRVPESVNASGKAPFSSMHARVLCHATEVRERVERAMVNAIGEAELDVASTQGRHGNDIVVIEARLKGREAGDLLGRLPSADLRRVIETAGDRIDDSCNLHIRIDKQKAFKGEVVLAADDDAIAIRMKVTAFPAKKPLAVQAATDFLVTVANRA